MRVSNSHVLFQVLFYSSWLLAVLSVICNSIALIYISARRRNSSSSSVAITAPRKKKFKFDEIILLSLCFSNLLNNVLTSIDSTLMVIGVEPRLLFLITSYGTAFSLLVSLLNVLIFAGERLVSFRCPFFHRDLRRRYLVLILVSCWSVSVAPTTQLHSHRDIYFLTLCGVMVFSNLFLIFSYFYIFTVMKKTINNRGVIPASTKSFTGTGGDYTFTRERAEMNIKTTIMCLSIVLTYFLCTVPPTAWMIMNRGVGISHREGKSSVMVMYLLLILRTLFDPLVYILRNKLFNFSMLILDRMRFMWKESSVNHHHGNHHSDSIPSHKQKFPEKLKKKDEKTSSSHERALESKL